MNIGDKIKAARIAKGMTQKELGEVLGVQSSAVAKYESGRVVNLKRSALKKIADVLDLRPSDLIIEADPETVAELHARILRDTEAVEMMADYYSLDDSTQTFVRQTVHGLALAQRSAKKPGK